MSEIRRATPADAPAIARIYNWYVENTVVTFEVDPVSDAEMARRIESTLEKYEWLVTARAGEVLGYAYAGRFRERAAYRFITESTIYLRNGLQGQGLGKPLYRATIERTFALGYTSLVGAIALPNDASVRLARVARLREGRPPAPRRLEARALDRRGLVAAREVARRLRALDQRAGSSA